MAEELDALDALIESERVKEGEEGAGNPPENNGKPAGDLPAGNPPNPAPGKTENGAAAPNTPSQPTPKEILGIEDDSWDNVKARLGEAENLRQELEQAKSRPTVAFANESVAAFNRFVELTKIEDHGVFNRMMSTDLNDPLQVLCTKFIKDHPKFSGQEEKVLKKLAADYKVDAVAYPDEDVDFNKIRLEQDADVAKTEITGLRESLKTVGAPSTPVDFAARETEWTEALSKELLSLDKISIPTLSDKKDDKGNPIWEKFTEYEIPKELKASYITARAKANAKISDAKSPEAQRAIKVDFMKEFLFNNFGAMNHATITKAKAEERLKVQSEYDGAGKLTEKDAVPASDEEDPYKTFWNK